MKTAIGVDIGGMSIKIGFVDSEGNIKGRHSFPVNYSLKQEEIIEQLGRDINESIASSGLRKEDLSGIGIGCPGAINTKTGYCDYASNLHWENLDICGIVSKITGLPSKIGNDANVAILGEAKFGAGKNYHNIVLLTLGTGVGGGLYLNDQLFEGNEGKGGELGHVSIDINGRPCGCGRKGCFEKYASASALVADTKEKMLKVACSSMWDYCGRDIEKVDGRTAFECAKKGDKAANEVVDQYIRFLGEGILNFCNIFRPDAILLSGGLSNQKEYLTDKLEAYMKEWNYGFPCTPSVEIKIAKLGSLTGIYGAASLQLF